MLQVLNLFTGRILRAADLLVHSLQISMTLVNPRDANLPMSMATPYGDSCIDRFT